MLQGAIPASTLFVPLVTLAGTLVINLITMSKQKRLDTTLQNLSKSQDRKHEIYPEMWQKINHAWYIADKLLSDRLPKLEGSLDQIGQILKSGGFNEDVISVWKARSSNDHVGQELAEMMIKLQAYSQLVSRYLDAEDYFEKWKPYFKNGLRTKIREMVDVLETVATVSATRSATELQALKDDIEMLIRKELND